MAEWSSPDRNPALSRRRAPSQQKRLNDRIGADSDHSGSSPAARDEDKAAAGDAPDNDQRQSEQKTGEDHRHPIIAAVGEDRSQPAVEPLDPRQQRSGAVGVLDAGGVDEDAEQEARGVDRDVTLAALDLRGRVKASAAPFSVVLTLWVPMMVADGVGSRPSCSRSITTK
ncbi:hypothetical protein [Azospirillum argentinense]|uniref:hypothetical protein n=1 Tax=Azospirillum argentinense TaxID=2970906 RepID=UPI0020004C13|nr:hypothetical protein [Azospirillum argentinense]